MKVRVLFFATLRDYAGDREQQVELPTGATIADLKAHLAGRSERMDQALASAIASVNKEFAFAEEILNEGDEVALFPPVSGGLAEEPLTLLQVTEDSLDMNELVAAIVRPTTGAACVFSGVVRAHTERGQPRETERLEYEAYRPMAVDKMRQVAEEIRARWSQVEGIAIVQRIGTLEPGTPTVLIACSGGHRDSGVFEAARYGIDRLKEIVPIWKKEIGADGETWVEGGYQPTRADREE